MPSRRAFLEWGVGAAAGVAALAWRNWPKPDPSRLDPAQVARITGSIIGPSFASGHLLRQDPGSFGRAAVELKARTVIIGSGIAGLSCAWALDRAGWSDYLMLELEPRPGGTSSWAEYPGVSSAPWAAHYLPVPTEESRIVRVLLEDLAVITGHDAAGRPVYREEFLCQAPQERIHTFDTWLDGLYPRLGASQDDLEQLKAFHRDMERWRRLKVNDGRRPFAIPRACSSRDPRLLELDRMSMAEYMQRQGWTSPRLRWFVQYACRDDYGCKLEKTSAWAAIHYYTSRGHSGKTAGQSLSESDELLTWPSGNGWLAEQLASRVGSRLRKPVMVMNVREEGDGVVVEGFDPPTGRGIRVDAREAVICVPRFIAAKVVPAYGQPRKAALRSFSYAPWIVSNVVVEREPVNAGRGGQVLSWDNVMYESEGLGYVVATHQSLRTVDGPTVLTHYAPMAVDPVTARTWALEVPWATWRDRVLRDLSAPHPGIERTVRSIDVMVWGHAMVRPTPGFVWSDALEQAAAPCGKIHFAHTDLSGIAIFEEAQYHGVRAAEAIMKGAGHPFEALS